MVTKCWYILFFLFFCSCSSREAKQQANKELLINDIFLSVIDTVGYSQRSLLALGSDTLIPYSINDTFQVAFDPYLFSLKEWLQSIDSIFKTTQTTTGFDTVYISLRKRMKADQANLSSKVEVEKIQNTGRYKLITTYDFSSRETLSGFVGVVRFSDILFNDQADKAFCIVEIKDAFKSSRYELLFCEKVLDKWKLKKREIIAAS
jgi:hypothetical protein